MRIWRGIEALIFWAVGARQIETPHPEDPIPAFWREARLAESRLQAAWCAWNLAGNQTAAGEWDALKGAALALRGIEQTAHERGMPLPQWAAMTQRALAKTTPAAQAQEAELTPMQVRAALMDLAECGSVALDTRGHAHQVLCALSEPLHDRALLWARKNGKWLLTLEADAGEKK